MPRYEPLGPDAEVLGAAMLGFLQATNVENTKPHLERAGLETIDPDTWYPQRVYTEIFNSMVDSPNVSMDFVSIGMSIAQGVFPPDFDGMDFAEILSHWPEVYDYVNRGADRGYIRPEQISDKHFRIVHLTPYPDDLNYGVGYGICQRFLGVDRDFTVYFDEDEPRVEEGGQYTVVHIEWE